MEFLGKITIETGGRYFAITGSGNLAMRALPKDDPAAVFLAYAEGDGFKLQASNGLWVYLSSSESPIAWYPVLYGAYTRSYGTRFTSQFFKLDSGQVKLAWINGDGVKVALYLPNGINPNCNCEFDTTNGWGYGQFFGLRVLAPGIERLRSTKNGVDGDYGCAGKACVDLAGADLTGVDFTRANLQGAILAGTSLRDTTLTDAKFQGARLDLCDFRGAGFRGTDFSGCDLTRSVFSDPPGFSTDPAKRTKLAHAKILFSTLKKNWSYLDLTGATIVGLREQQDLSGLQAHDSLMADFDFSGVALEGANFERSALHSVNLRNGSARNSNFDRANLTSGQLQDADLSGATLRSAILRDCLMARIKLAKADFGPDPADPTAPGADLTGADMAFGVLTEAKLRSAVMIKTFLTGADLSGADLTGAQLGGQDKSLAAVLSFAYMANAKLDRANLYGVSFAGATFFGADASVAETATMEQASFVNAYLAGIDMSGARLMGAKFDGACLVNVILRDVNLSPTQSGSINASLTSATLQGADFTGSDLSGADLANAAVAFERGEIPVRHCDAKGQPFPPPPNSLPLRHGPTLGLDLTSMKEDTICPNGHTVKTNQQDGLDLKRMLTSANAPTTWYPKSCRPSGANLEAERQAWGGRGAEPTGRERPPSE